jgi:hypothetical protein
VVGLLLESGFEPKTPSAIRRMRCHGPASFAQIHRSDLSLLSAWLIESTRRGVPALDDELATFMHRGFAILLDPVPLDHGAARRHWELLILGRESISAKLPAQLLQHLHRLANAT